MIDKLFKVGLLVIGVILLILLYQISQKNRFYYHLKDEPAIFDTRTGKVYEPNKEEQKWTVANPISGEIKEIPYKRQK